MVQKITNLYAPIEPVSGAETDGTVERHPTCEAFLMLNGTCTYFLNGETLHLQPGDVCLILPWIPHQYGFWQKNEACDHLWFQPGNAFFVNIQHEPHKDFRALEHGRIPQEYLLLLNHLINDYKTDRNPASLRVFFQLLQLETEKISRSPQNSKTDLAETVKLFIRSRNGAKCSMAELEKYTGYCRSHIAHSFRNSCGFSVGDYINTVRQEYAAQALSFGMKQKEIAAALGFSSPAAFWQWFRKFR